jgi:O-antigen/teichoic acid export membrane protein
LTAPVSGPSGASNEHPADGARWLGGPSLARNVASNWALTVVSVLYALAMTPIIVRALGTEGYGAWHFLNGLLGYSSLLYLGVGSALVRQVALLSAKRDFGELNRIASVTVSVFAALGVFSLLVLAGVSPFAAAAVKILPEDPLTWQATYACVLLGLQVFLAFVTSGFVATILGRDRFDLVNITQILATAARFILVPLVVRGESPLLQLAIFLAVSTLVECVVFWTLAHRINRALRLRPAIATPAELRMLYSFGIPAFMISFSLRLISYTDTTVIGLAIGASYVALYALPLQLIEHSRVLIASYPNVLISKLTLLEARGDRAAMRGAYLSSLWLSALTAAFLLTSLIFAGPEFLGLWVGRDFEVAAPWILVWLSGATFLHVFYSIVALPFYQAMHILALPAGVLVGEAVVNLALSLVLSRVMGIEGVALATFIPACVSFMILSPVLCRAMSLRLFDAVWRVLPPAAAVAGAVAVTHLVLTRWLPGSSYTNLAFRVLASSGPAFALGMALSRKDDRHLLTYRLGSVAAWWSRRRAN